MSLPPRRTLPSPLRALLLVAPLAALLGCPIPPAVPAPDGATGSEDRGGDAGLPTDPDAAAAPDPDAAAAPDPDAAAAPDPDAAAAPDPDAAAALDPDAAGTPPEPGFLGGDDEALLATLCFTDPEAFRRNPRGTTLSFRLEFAGGTEALYKPEQSLSHSRWEAEVASYRLAHRLGIHRVPPSCPRSFDRETLLAAEGNTADSRQRIRDEVRFAEDGTVRGMVMYWVPDLRDEPLAVDGEWRWMVAVGGRIPAGKEDDAAALSDLLLLDWLTLNVDRWSGGNIRRQGEADGPFVFIDNAAGFGTDPWADTGRVWPRFRLAERFRRSVVERLRETDEAALRGLLGDVLSEEQLTALFERRTRALERIDELVERLGETRVLFFE